MKTWMFASLIVRRKISYFAYFYFELFDLIVCTLHKLTKTLSVILLSVFNLVLNFYFGDTFLKL